MPRRVALPYTPLRAGPCTTPWGRGLGPRELAGCWSSRATPVGLGGQQPPGLGPPGRPLTALSSSAPPPGAPPGPRASLSQQQPPRGSEHCPARRPWEGRAWPCPARRPPSSFPLTTGPWTQALQRGSSCLYEDTTEWGPSRTQGGLAHAFISHAQGPGAPEENQWGGRRDTRDGAEPG